MELAADILGNVIGSLLASNFVLRYVFFRMIPVVITVCMMWSVWRFRRALRKVIATRERILNNLEA